MKRWPLAISTRTAPSTIVGTHAEALLDARGQRLGLVGLQHHHVAADARAQFGRAALGHHGALVQQRQPVAAVGFFQDVGGQQNGDAFV